MKKQEALEFIKNRKGFVEWAMLYDIYDDDDEIPQGLINMQFKESKPRQDVLYCSPFIAEQLNELLKDELK